MKNVVGWAVVTLAVVAAATLPQELYRSGAIGAVGASAIGLVLLASGAFIFDRLPKGTVERTRSSSWPRTMVLCMLVAATIFAVYWHFRGPL